MKICLSNSFYYPDIVGGAEISVLKLAYQLDKMGNDIHVLCTGDKDKFEVIDGIKVHRIKIHNICNILDLSKMNCIKKSIFILMDIYNIFNYRKILREIKSINPDLIHSNNLSGISTIIWSIAKKLKIPIVQTMRDYALIESKNKYLKLIKRVIYKKLSKNVNIVTAPSKYTLNRFIDAGYFKNSHKEVVYNSIDIDKDMCKEVFEAKKNLIRNKRLINFVYAGRLEEEKGIRFLVEYFTKVNTKNIRLNIAGKGNLEDELKEWIKDDKRIKYNGFLNEKQLNNLLKKSDVLIIPSIWPEPFGRVIIEAYKFSMPVIGCKSGGIPEIIEDNITGKLIDYRKPDELIDAIEYFSHNKNILNMLESCLNKVNSYNIENQGDIFERLYNSI